MADQYEAETVALRTIVMAALSARHRRTAHPADRHALQAQANRIALAIQGEFALFPRQKPACDAPDLRIPLSAES
ncbi:hypothetical protein [Acidisoma silvae]|uniref:Uncharacterized protein n=1 Tax=Acidisoma silvae TaxID=2802396 RepID=A0A963YTG4_9PROT|nr:hypothetical protein [Acidisoma silvae]MCB8876125.1 hypothetical protein [Acidisoma silvae]